MTKKTPTPWGLAPEDRFEAAMRLAAVRPGYSLVESLKDVIEAERLASTPSSSRRPSRKSS